MSNHGEEAWESDHFMLDDALVSLPVLKERAFNYRWATLPSGVLPLTAASSDFPVARCVVDAIVNHVMCGYFPYGPSHGLPAFRVAAANYFSERLQAGANSSLLIEPGLRNISSDVVMACNAAAAGIYAVSFALLAPGDEVLVMDPVDFLLDSSIKACRCTVVRYSLSRSRERNEPRFDLAQLERLVSRRTRLLSICNPVNPLGIAWTAEELMQLATFAEVHDLAILSDEVWCDIVHPPFVHVPTASVSSAAAERTYTVLGFSKSHGLEGLRVGAVVAPSAAVLKRVVAASHTDSTANGCSTLAQVAAIAAMEGAGSIESGWLHVWRSHLAWAVRFATNRLNKMAGVIAVCPEACFIVWADVSTIIYPSEADRVGPPREGELCQFLIDHHRVAVIPGLESFFGPASRGHIRLSVATSRAILSVALDRLEEGLAAFATRRRSH